MPLASHRLAAGWLQAGWRLARFIEQAAHAALKVESGKLLEGVQAQMTGAVSQLTAQVKELSGKLAKLAESLDTDEAEG